jgi:hypothetical protein
LNLEKSVNNISKRLEKLGSQETVNKDKIDSDQIAKQRYDEYKEHWYFHKSSWYMRGLNVCDGQGCNRFTGCVPECKFYEEEGKLTEDEGFD